MFLVKPALSAVFGVTIPTMKSDSGSIMLWGYFSAADLGLLLNEMINWIWAKYSQIMSASEQENFWKDEKPKSQRNSFQKRKIKSRIWGETWLFMTEPEQLATVRGKPAVSKHANWDRPVHTNSVSTVNWLEVDALCNQLFCVLSLVLI